MPLILLRALFIMVAVGLSVRLVNSQDLPDGPQWLAWVAFFGIVSLSLVVILVDVLVRPKRLEIISAVYFGMVVGLFLTYVFQLALSPILPVDAPTTRWAPMLLGIVLCYTCISLLLQTKDDFRLIIPYVEFAREVKGLKPFVLDTSVVIDGRIADVVETEVFDNQLIMPRFVIGELQGIADSSDKLRRTRGRRGLDVLDRLRNNPGVDFTIYDRDLPEFSGQPVDLKLVLLARHLDGKVVTNDYNLNKVARLHDVGVVNLNDLANALKPAFLPGEEIEVQIVKQGEEPGQGVGYLDDGTMVVVEGGRDHVHQGVKVTVTSVLQTSAGRMVFGRFEVPANAEA
ncbi:MAG: PIN/TRAM domain-containing protein [Pirellulales bacterium]